MIDIFLIKMGIIRCRYSNRCVFDVRVTVVGVLIVVSGNFTYLIFIDSIFIFYALSISLHIIIIILISESGSRIFTFLFN